MSIHAVVLSVVAFQVFFGAAAQNIVVPDGNFSRRFYTWEILESETAFKHIHASPFSSNLEAISVGGRHFTFSAGDWLESSQSAIGTNESIQTWNADLNVTIFSTESGDLYALDYFGSALHLLGSATGNTSVVIGKLVGTTGLALELLLSDPQAFTPLVTTNMVTANATDMSCTFANEACWLLIGNNTVQHFQWNSPLANITPTLSLSITGYSFSSVAVHQNEVWLLNADGKTAWRRLGVTSENPAGERWMVFPLHLPFPALKVTIGPSGIYLLLAGGLVAKYQGFEPSTAQTPPTIFEIDTYDDRILLGLDEKGQMVQSTLVNATPTSYGVLIIYNEMTNTWGTPSSLQLYYLKAVTVGETHNYAIRRGKSSFVSKIDLELFSISKFGAGKPPSFAVGAGSNSVLFLVEDNVNDTRLYCDRAFDAGTFLRIEGLNAMAFGDFKSISCGRAHCWGLKSNGTSAFISLNETSPCSKALNGSQPRLIDEGVTFKTVDTSKNGRTWAVVANANDVFVRLGVKNRTLDGVMWAAIPGVSLRDVAVGRNIVYGIGVNGDFVYLADKDGNWTSWSTWSECSVSCNGGMQLRRRYCHRPAPLYDGKNCTGQGVEQRSCNQQICIGYQWSGWSSWSVCSGSCPVGQSTRTRSCMATSNFTENTCSSGNTQETMICLNQCYGNQTAVIERYINEPWQDVRLGLYCLPSNTFLTISSSMKYIMLYFANIAVPKSAVILDAFIQFTCKNSYTSSHRVNVLAVYDPRSVTQEAMLTCNFTELNYSSPISWHAGTWQEDERGIAQQTPTLSTLVQAVTGAPTWNGTGPLVFSLQNVTDGYRTIDSFDEDPFKAPMLHIKYTQEYAVPVNSTWSAWSSWSNCSHSCFSGKQNRTRQCKMANVDLVLPAWLCQQAASFQEQICNQQHCDDMEKCIKAINGTGHEVCCMLNLELEDTSIYNECFLNLSLLTYQCPLDRYGLANGTCVPVHGKYSKWSQWSPCNQTCSSGTQTRSRSCTKPAPKYNGLPCNGSSVETDICNMQLCPDHPNCTHATAADSTSVCCYDNCQLVSGIGGGYQCNISSLIGVGTCDPVSGNWSSWQQWSQCNPTMLCKAQQRQRHRFCNNPPPLYGGSCAGPSVEFGNCSENCIPDGVWSNWELLQPCNVTCGEGNQTWHRTCHAVNASSVLPYIACEGAYLMTNSCTLPSCSAPVPSDIHVGSSSAPTSLLRAMQTTDVAGPWSITTQESISETMQGYESSSASSGNEDHSTIDSMKSGLYSMTSSSQPLSTVLQQTMSSSEMLPLKASSSWHMSSNTNTTMVSTSIASSTPLIQSTHSLSPPSLSYKLATVADSSITFIATESLMTSLLPSKIRTTGQTIAVPTSVLSTGPGLMLQSTNNGISSLPTPALEMSIISNSTSGTIESVLTSRSLLHGNTKNISTLYATVSNSGTVTQQSIVSTAPVGYANSTVITGAFEVHQSVSSGPFEINQSVSSGALEINQSERTAALEVNQSVSSTALEVNQSVSSTAFEVNQSVSSGALEINQSERTAALEVNQSVSSPALEVNQSVSSAALVVSPSASWQIISSESMPVSSRIGGGIWAQWGECSVSCGQGVRTRYSECINAEDCAMPVAENSPCRMNPCPVDGKWSHWSSWSACDRSCDGGIRVSLRNCTNPPPQHNGRNCDGNFKKTKECNLHICPVDGGWGEWSMWGHCDKPCNEGYRRRLRICNSPHPRYNGKACIGQNEERVECNRNPCKSVIINVATRFKNENFTNDLIDRNSVAFANLKEKIRNNLLAIYQNSSVVLNVTIISFKKGSVIADFTVNYKELSTIELVILATFLDERKLLGEMPVGYSKINSTNVPPPPDTLTAESISSTSIRLHWSSFAAALSEYSSNLTGFLITYKKAVDSETGGWQRMASPPNSSTIDVMYLIPYVLYTFRVTAMTITGLGIPSQYVDAFTQQGVPTGPPVNFTCQPAPEKSLFCEWKDIPRDNINGELSSFQLKYRVYDRFNGNSSVDWRNVTLSSTKRSYTIANLAAYTRYEVELFGSTIAGDGPPTWTQAKTYEGVPSMAPPNITVLSSQSENSIDIDWKALAKEHWNGVPVGIIVFYQVKRNGSSAILNGAWQQHMLQFDETHHQLGGLVVNSAVSFYLVGVTSVGEGVPSARVFGETCRCSSMVYVAWYERNPYIVSNNGVQTGIFPELISKIVKNVCGVCKAHGYPKVYYDRSRSGKNPIRGSERDLRNKVDDAVHFHFPVTGNKAVTIFEGKYQYVQVIDDTGSVFIVVDQNLAKKSEKILQILYTSYPVVLVMAVFMVTTGIILWFADQAQNPYELKKGHFFRGVLNGAWWAFITMTTVGYGDIAPKSFGGRIVAVAWIVVGLVLSSIFVSTLTTAIIVASVNEDIKLYGTKVASLYNSPEYWLGYRRLSRITTTDMNGKNFTTAKQLLEAVINGQVKGALLEANEASTLLDFLSQNGLRVNKRIKTTKGIGMLLSGEMKGLHEDIRTYVRNSNDMIERLLKNGTNELKVTSQSLRRSSITRLFDSKSALFQMSLKLTLIIFGALFGFGLLWQFCLRSGIRKLKKIYPRTNEDIIRERYFKDANELFNDVDHFINNYNLRMEDLFEEQMKERFRLVVKHSKTTPYGPKGWLRYKTLNTRHILSEIKAEEIINENVMNTQRRHRRQPNMRTRGELIEGREGICMRPVSLAEHETEL